MRSSWTRAQTRVPCIGRRILNHCATRKVPPIPFKLVRLPLQRTDALWLGMVNYYTLKQVTSLPQLLYQIRCLNRIRSAQPVTPYMQLLTMESGFFMYLSWRRIRSSSHTLRMDEGAHLWSCPSAESTLLPSVTIQCKGSRCSEHSAWCRDPLCWCYCASGQRTILPCPFVFSSHQSGKATNLDGQLLVFSVLVPKKLKAVLGSHIKGQISSTLNIWLSPSNGDFIFSVESEELPSGGGSLGSEGSESWVCHYGGEKVRWAEEGSNVAR